MPRTLNDRIELLLDALDEDKPGHATQETVFKRLAKCQRCQQWEERCMIDERSDAAWSRLMVTEGWVCGGFRACRP